MWKTYEEETYTVNVSRERNKEFGLHICELWKNSADKQFRPNDLPSCVMYDAKTGKTLYEEWTLENVHGITRNGNKPCAISYNPKRPYRVWGTLQEGNKIEERPTGCITDEHTGEISKYVYENGDSRPDSASEYVFYRYVPPSDIPEP